MLRDPIEKSLAQYQLTQDKGEAYERLGILFRQAANENLHEQLGLPQRLHTRAMKEVPNFRVAVTKLLHHHLATEPTSEEVAAGRELVREIIEAIATIEQIEADLKDLEYDENGKNAA